jgi:hypothetical protein
MQGSDPEPDQPFPTSRHLSRPNPSGPAPIPVNPKLPCRVRIQITIDVKDPTSDSKEMPTSGRFGRDPPTRQRHPQPALFPPTS